MGGGIIDRAGAKLDPGKNAAAAVWVGWWQVPGHRRALALAAFQQVTEIGW